jgi:hypothetical protein
MEKTHDQIVVKVVEPKEEDKVVQPEESKV